MRDAIAAAAARRDVVLMVPSLRCKVRQSSTKYRFPANPYPCCGIGKELPSWRGFRLPTSRWHDWSCGRNILFLGPHDGHPAIRMPSSGKRGNRPANHRHQGGHLAGLPPWTVADRRHPRDRRAVPQRRPRELAKTSCAHLGGTTATGDFKVGACLGMMETLDCDIPIVTLQQGAPGSTHLPSFHSHVIPRSMDPTSSLTG